MGNKVSFKIEYVKWYLVDMTNWHHPVIVRKHLFTKKEAKAFRDKHYPDFEIIYGKKAIELNIKDWHNAKPKHRHRNVSKYDWPEHAKTQYQRKIHRGIKRKAMKRKAPKLTLDIIKDILREKPLHFIVIQMRKYQKNHWAFSDKVGGFKKILEKYESKSYQDMVYISNIVRLLESGYDCGLYKRIDVAFKIFDLYGDLLKRIHTGVKIIPTNEKKVREEFLARGFIESDGMMINKNHISTIHIKKRMVYPGGCWHSVKDKLYPEGEYIYDLHERIGIPGFTKADVAGLDSRK